MAAGGRLPPRGYSYGTVLESQLGAWCESVACQPPLSAGPLDGDGSIADVAVLGLGAYMAAPLQNPPPGFDELALDQQIEYIQALWDRIAERAGQVPLHDWQQQLLQERLQAHSRAPGDARPWAEVLDRLEGRLRQARGR